MKRPIVTMLGLGLAACSSHTPPQDTEQPTTADSPIPPPSPDMPTHNPPRPPPADPPPPPAQLPTWEKVKSGHPKGATNPPRPELIVTPEGACFKKWVPSMAPVEVGGDRVEACEEGCGTPIQCPPKAEELLADWKKEHE